MIYKWLLWLRNVNVAVFVTVLCTASYVVVVPLAIVESFYPSLQQGTGPSSLQSSSLLFRIIVGALIFPLVETVLLQFLPIRLIYKQTKTTAIGAVFTSSVLFAGVHYYSVGYVVFAFLVGIILAGGFVIRDVSAGRPFLSILCAHILRNLVSAFVMTS